MATIPAPATATASSAAPAGEVALFRRRRATDDDRTARADVLIVGLGNPGDRYAGTRHNIGFEIGRELSHRWDMPRARKRFGGLIAEGRIRPGGPRAVILFPQTFMNESGQAASPARGELRLPVERVVVLHDEIDLPFGRIEARLGGGLAGHNGLKSLKRGLGDDGFWRIRAGVGRPDSTDPEVVSGYVLGRFRESDDEVRGLIAAAADETERLVDRLATAEPAGAGEDAS